MKKLFYLFSIILIIGIVSCSKDDDKKEIDIIGRWDLSEMKMNGSFTEDGMTINFTGITKNIQGENYVIFKEDNTAVGQNSEFDMEIEYTINGMTFTMTVPAGNNFPESGTWEKNGDKLRLTDSTGETTNFTIEELTANSLILSADGSDMELGDEFPENATVHVTITMER